MARRKALTVEQVIKAMDKAPSDYEVVASVHGGGISGEVYEVVLSPDESAVYLHCR